MQPVLSTYFQYFYSYSLNYTDEMLIIRDNMQKIRMARISAVTEHFKISKSLSSKLNFDLI